MLTDFEFHQYCQSSGLAKTAWDYLGQVRTSEPSRKVGAYAHTNICSSIDSNKMGHTISVESRSAEKAFLLISDYDDRVLEIWDQPEPVNVVRTNKNGHRRGGTYTPDFMIITKERPVVIEVKNESDIERLSSKNPKDWQKIKEDKYIYRPALEAFSELGLAYEVFVYKREYQYLAHNLELLMQSRLVCSATVSSDELNSVFQESYVWTLRDLKDRLELPDFQPLVQMIDRKQLFFDIKGELISVPEGCNLVREPALLELYRESLLSGKAYKDGEDSTISSFSQPSQRQANSALKKISELESGRNDRSARRWRKQIADGVKQGLSPIESLIPKHVLSGNRQRKINKKVDEYLQAFLLNEHAESQGRSVYWSHKAYESVASKAHPSYPPVSIATFRRHLARIPEELIARKRGGKRMANAKAEPSNPLDRSMKALLPWQTAAVDHYLADIYLVFYSDQGIAYTMRPWVTAMIDQCSSAILAIAVSFRAPSCRSVSKVIRACVRQHGKLPKEIIIDRGSDFTSVYFSSLLAHYRVDHSLRPTGHSRYGGEIEGFFGDFKKQWLCQRKGNMADYKEARSVDGKLSPRNQAVYEPYQFYQELLGYCEWRNSKPVGIRQQSPGKYLADVGSNFPFIGTSIVYDDSFLLATSVDGGRYKIDFQRGIHIDALWYSSPRIFEVRGRHKRLEVRIDPENPHRIFALVDSDWVPCYSGYINSYAAKDTITQLVEGMTVLDASKARKAIASEADTDLSRRAAEFDQIHSSSVAQLSEQLLGEEDVQEFAEEDIAFEIDLDSIEIQEWEG